MRFLMSRSDDCGSVRLVLPSPANATDTATVTLTTSTAATSGETRQVPQGTAQRLSIGLHTLRRAEMTRLLLQPGGHQTSHKCQVSLSDTALGEKAGQITCALGAAREQHKPGRKPVNAVHYSQRIRGVMAVTLWQ